MISSPRAKAIPPPNIQMQKTGRKVAITAIDLFPLLIWSVRIPMRPSEDTDIPPALRSAYARCHHVVMSYLHWLGFTVMDTGRDPEYLKNHLLSYTAQDLIETSMMSLTCIREGIHNPVIREMRSLLESSIKLTYVQQQDYRMPIADKLQQFRSELADHKISRMREVDLRYLSDESQSLFLEDVGRMYGRTSRYVHHTADVIQERIARVDQGRTVGKESTEDINAVTDIIQRVMAQSIVFISHAVPQYVIGDFLVDYDMPLSDWHYLKYRYIAEIDTTLDCKAERQEALEAIKKRRAENVEF